LAGLQERVYAADKAARVSGGPPAANDQEVPRRMKNRKRQGVTVGAVAGLVAAFAVAWMASVGAAISPAGVTAATSQYEKKVTICHRTGSKKNPFRTIRVSRNAVRAHLRHGDALGPCGSAVFTMCHKTKNGKKHTVKVKGARKAQRAMKHGDKLGKCKGKKHNSGKHKGKHGDKKKDKPKHKG
jgi:ribosomal protein S14